MVTSCLPLDPSGVPLPILAQAPADERNGASGSRYSFADMLQQWPYHFSRMDGGALAIDVLLLSDVATEDGAGFEWTPLMAPDALALQEQRSAGVPNAGDRLGTGINLEYMRTYKLQLSAKLTIHLDGSETLQYSFENSGYSATSPVQVERGWSNLLNVSSPAERSRLIELRARSNVTLLMTTLSYIPAFDVRVVREVQTYTVSTFIAELGQAASIAARELQSADTLRTAHI
jgi:hypothetical protein